MMVGLKAGLSIGGALVAWILSMYDYVPLKNGQTAIQPESVAQGVKLLVSVFPAIPFLIGAGLLFFYIIDKKMEVKIEQELKIRRIKNKNN